MGNSERIVFTDPEWAVLGEKFSLPPRQMQILKQIFRGSGRKQISFHLGISPHTVREHLRRLYARFGVQNRHELILEIFARLREKCRQARCPLK